MLGKDSVLSRLARMREVNSGEHSLPLCFSTRRRADHIAGTPGKVS